MIFPRDWRYQAAVSFAALPLSLWASRTYRALPRLPQPVPAGPLPSLSIVIPARNEAHNLSHLLSSLQRLRYPGPLEVLVVDDASSDGTAEVAAAHGARVLRVDRLPAGWAGKPHACAVGAQQAQGDWLLFTDADTVHQPDSAARAVAYAQQHETDGLSLFLHQQSRGWLDRLALTAGYAGLFAGSTPQRDLFNGQYMLLRRSVYAAIGGFEQVRGEALEDLALGKLLRGRGYRVPILLGEDAAEVRMFSSTMQLWHGMNRLSADALRLGGARMVWASVFITALMSPWIAVFGSGSRGPRARWTASTWAAVAFAMRPWAERFGSGVWAVLAPVGALFVELAAVWGLLNRVLHRGIAWKGRRV